jgi:predicted transporter
MRIRALLGAAMILAGGLILARGISYTTRTDVVNLGSVRVSTDEKKPVAPWIGGVVALAGLALIFAGGSRKS